ncbi:MAG: GAF domain-containing sensor histidine kinase [Oscillochloris sp.]|nr:GAF domain-containing sensor histidine kinase [Oscillochloris sp.]
MARIPPPDRHPFSGVQQLVVRLLDTPTGAKIANFGPVAWLTRIVVRNVVRRQLARDVAPAEWEERIASADLASTLQSIVTDVVETLGYVGAMVATYDPDGALPIRAWFVDREVASKEQITAWEAQISRLSPHHAISLSDPATARVYVDRPEYSVNLSSRAFKQQQPVSSPDMLDLFRPIVPDNAASAIKGIQEAIGVHEVMAVPFFLEMPVDGAIQREFVGNLFVLAATAISDHDRHVLAAFGRQAAAALLSDRRRSQTQAVLRLIFDIQTNLVDEGQILQQIVEGVVKHLAYIGAFVATYEDNDALAVQAWHFDPSVASRQQILAWEAQISQLTPDRPISLDPEVARVYVNQPDCQENLGTKAFKQQKPVVTTDLYDLFRPVVPASAIPVLQGIQAALNMHLAVAVPFFFYPPDGKGEPEFVGNLFALSRTTNFSNAEIEVLQAFGQQAAAGLRNARLYRQAENRRKAAEIFGKMAFTAAASVHDLKNKVGVVRGNLQVVKILPPEQLTALRGELTEPVFRNLDQMADILDSLHEPWQQVPDVLIDINQCVEKAIVKIMQSQDKRDLQVVRQYASDLPTLPGSHDMMVEAFKVLIKNAAEAVAEKGTAGLITVQTSYQAEQQIVVVLRDNGIGIKSEHLTRIFDMRWSTKGGAGLGFGLFWTRDYIEGLGGSVNVNSTYGEGATFVVSIPITKGTPPA